MLRHFHVITPRHLITSCRFFAIHIDFHYVIDAAITVLIRRYAPRRFDASDCMVHQRYAAAADAIMLIALMPPARRYVFMLMPPIFCRYAAADVSDDASVIC